MQGFSWCYVTAWQGTRLQAAMPAFLTEYSLDTTLDSKAKKITDRIKAFFPRLLTVKLACLGSPHTEYGQIGFHPDVIVEEKPILLSRLVTAFENYATSFGCVLIGIKDIPLYEQHIWQATNALKKYQSMAALPVASMEINFSTMDQYFATMSANTRKDMRRKLRSADKIRIEERINIDDVLPEIMMLYHETRQRAEMKFEELTPEFFQNVLSFNKGNAFFMLYFIGNNLLAANLLLKNEHQLLDKFFCMNKALGRQYNLYFLSWFSNINYCLERGISNYQSGQAAYQNKLRLGSRLIPTTMYYCHRNKIIQSLLKLLSPLLSPDNSEENLKRKISFLATNILTLRLKYRPHWLLIPLLIAINQVFIKLLARAMDTIPLGIEWVLHAFQSPWIYAIIFCESTSLILWMRILQEIDVSRAVPLTGMAYILILLIGWVFFKESIDLFQILGSLCVFTGIWFISTSESRS